MKFQENLIRQRELVDEIKERVQELMELNRQVQADHQTEFVILIGQHRHTFEEQKVIDHSGCISFLSASGGDKGVIGLLGMWADRQPLAKIAIQIVHNYFNK